MREKSRPVVTADDPIDFGDEIIPASEKSGRVRAVFDSVASSYDIMNDVMSLGIHRRWKDTLIRLISPTADQHLIDLAGGTGDISARFLRAGGGSATIVDINTEMMAAGRKRGDLSRLQHLSWVAGDAQAIPIADHTADIVTIAFGLRNVTDRDAAIAEAFRILKPGGRFFCLEFSRVRSRPLSSVYAMWSALLPGMGQLIANDSESYRYLVESIRRFPPQEEISAKFAAAGFSRVKCRDLSYGIAAIHCGWKLEL
jgi:demethylmenaquinone methyltransferase/2-methoxy-6-polyprenyl-1,4-benzoquinol methylase